MLRVGLVAQDGGQWCDRGGIIAAPVLHKTDIQPDSSHVRFEFLGLLQQCDGVVPLFAAHGDDTEIGIGGAGTRVGSEHLTKGRFCRVEVPGLKRRLPSSEPASGVHALFRTGWRGTGVPL